MLKRARPGQVRRMCWLDVKGTRVGDVDLCDGQRKAHGASAMVTQIVMAAVGHQVSGVGSRIAFTGVAAGCTVPNCI